MDGLNLNLFPASIMERLNFMQLPIIRRVSNFLSLSTEPAGPPEQRQYKQRIPGRSTVGKVTLVNSCMLVQQQQASCGVAWLGVKSAGASILERASRTARRDVLSLSLGSAGEAGLLAFQTRCEREKVRRARVNRPASPSRSSSNSCSRKARSEL